MRKKRTARADGEKRGGNEKRRSCSRLIDTRTTAMLQVLVPNLKRSLPLSKIQIVRQDPSQLDLSLVIRHSGKPSSMAHESGAVLPKILDLQRALQFLERDKLAQRLAPRAIAHTSSSCNLLTRNQTVSFPQLAARLGATPEALMAVPRGQPADARLPEHETPPSSSLRFYFAMCRLLELRKSCYTQASKDRSGHSFCPPRRGGSFMP